MTNKIEIKAFDSEMLLLFTIIALHFDCLIDNNTIIQNITSVEVPLNCGSMSFNKCSDWFIPEKVDHFEIGQDLFKLYYESGNHLEVRRING